MSIFNFGQVATIHFYSACKILLSHAKLFAALGYLLTNFL